jgi:hypothetical protein
LAETVIIGRIPVEELNALINETLSSSSVQEGFMFVNNWKTFKRAAVLKTFHSRESGNPRTC